MPFDKWEMPFKNGVMATSFATLDSAGRVVIPKALRDQLHLEAGDKFDVEVEGGKLMLSPADSANPLRKERGVWVFRTGRPIPASATDQILREIRARSSGE